MTKQKNHKPVCTIDLALQKYYFYDHSVFDVAIHPQVRLFFYKCAKLGIKKEWVQYEIKKIAVMEPICLN